MQRNELLKYILDIEAVINELEQIVVICDKNFFTFSENFMAVRSTERNLEIIGEAINRITKIDPQISISGTKHIIGLRNLIAHSYDTIDPEILWGILLKDIPVLKKELQELKE